MRIPRLRTSMRCAAYADIARFGEVRAFRAVVDVSIHRWMLSATRSAQSAGGGRLCADSGRPGRRRCRSQRGTPIVVPTDTVTFLFDRHRGIDGVVGAGTGDDGGGRCRAATPSSTRSCFASRGSSPGRARRRRQCRCCVQAGDGWRRRGAGHSTGTGRRGAWLGGADRGAHRRSSAPRTGPTTSGHAVNPVCPAAGLRPRRPGAAVRRSRRAGRRIDSRATPRSAISGCTVLRDLARPRAGVAAGPSRPGRTARRAVAKPSMSIVTISRSPRASPCGAESPRLPSCVASRWISVSSRVAGSGGVRATTRLGAAGRRRVRRPVR